MTAQTSESSSQNNYLICKTTHSFFIDLEYLNLVPATFEIKSWIETGSERCKRKILSLKHVTDIDRHNMYMSQNDASTVHGNICSRTQRGAIAREVVKKRWEPCSKCLASWHQIRKCLCLCLQFAYAHTGFAYADTVSYGELTLACTHQSFAYATPF